MSGGPHFALHRDDGVSYSGHGRSYRLWDWAKLQCPRHAGVYSWGAIDDDSRRLAWAMLHHVSLCGAACDRHAAAFTARVLYWIPPAGGRLEEGEVAAWLIAQELEHRLRSC